MEGILPVNRGNDKSDSSDHPLFLNLCLELSIHNGGCHQSDNAKGCLEKQHGT